MRKNNLNNVAIITAGSMAASITSSVTDVRWLDNLILYFSFTGTPTGTFAVQVGPDGTSWYDLPLTPAPVASGAANSYRIDMNQIGDSYIRLVYTRTSGTGTLNASLVGKML